MSTKPLSGDVRERSAKGNFRSYAPFSLSFDGHVLVAGKASAELAALVVRALSDRGGTFQDPTSIYIPIVPSSAAERPSSIREVERLIDAVFASASHASGHGLKRATEEHAPRDSSEQSPSPGAPDFAQVAASGAKLIADLEALRASIDSSTGTLAAIIRQVGAHLNKLQEGHRGVWDARVKVNATAEEWAAQQAPDTSHDAKPNPAALELQAMRERMGIRQTDAGQDDAQVQAMHIASEAAKKAWIDDGLLIGSTEMSKAWARSRQAIDLARERGEVFGIKIANRLWYPASFAALAAEHVKAVCLALQPLQPVAKFIFWQRPHGALQGRTIPEALQLGDVQRAVQVAEAFKQQQVSQDSGRERGLVLNEDLRAIVAVAAASTLAQAETQGPRASTKRAPARKSAEKYRAATTGTASTRAPAAPAPVKRAAAATPAKRARPRSA